MEHHWRDVGVWDGVVGRWDIFVFMGVRSGWGAAPASRRAEAVEPCGIFRPLAIAEMTRAADEGAGSHRDPNGEGQIRASFHHDDRVAGFGGDESKRIPPHAEAGAAGLHLRVSYYRLANAFHTRRRAVVKDCVQRLGGHDLRPPAALRFGASDCGGCIDGFGLRVQ